MSKTFENPSLIMDEQVSSPEDIDALMKNDQQAEAWYRFHLIRDLMQNKTADIIAPDLHLRIAEAVAEEPTLMVPAARKELKSWRRTISEWGEQLTSYAIAASVCTFILYSVQQIQSPEVENSSAITNLELIQPTDYQIANQITPFQEQLLDISRMSTIYGGEHIGQYAQGVNYSVAIPLKPIEKRVLELTTPEEQELEENTQKQP